MFCGLSPDFEHMNHKKSLGLQGKKTTCELHVVSNNVRYLIQMA